MTSRRHRMPTTPSSTTSRCRWLPTRRGTVTARLGPLLPRGHETSTRRPRIPALQHGARAFRKVCGLGRGPNPSFGRSSRDKRLANAGRINALAILASRSRGRRQRPVAVSRAPQGPARGRARGPLRRSPLHGSIACAVSLYPQLSLEPQRSPAGQSTSARQLTTHSPFTQARPWGHGSHSQQLTGGPAWQCPFAQISVRPQSESA